MKRPCEFNFSGVPGKPHKVTLDLDKVAFYNECLSEHGFTYSRTNVFIMGKNEAESRIILDIGYNEFKKIIENK